MAGALGHAFAQELCDVFLGWRLREDQAALLALGEGALRIDLVTGECWCDGDPLPALFIAGELQARVRAQESLVEGVLDAAFSERRDFVRGAERTALDLACRIVLVDAHGIEFVGEANNAASRHR